ncbi:1,4-alpha-glucan branching protein domain-containing protein [Desulfurispora thermophila]|uniref:1,4-alpha-glucan branching protein domain-containing protein n=1 Tax=Desulfurispora thermophila TaxID=265470 RepID=UPI000374A458|nr:1,4-alpha-glucan branching protein domain-containing protein [Desulfurispora thermophila]
MAYLMLVLHSHLPFVRRPEPEVTLEERWLYEAVRECYIPLLMQLEELADKGKKFRLTVSLSPPLLAMLSDDLLQDKIAQMLEKSIELAYSECRRTKNTVYHPVASMYLQQLTEIRRYFLFCGGNLLPSFKRLAEQGYLELITSCATHGFLPLMKSREVQKAQVHIGLQEFARHFGQQAAGIWLPECGYLPGLEDTLREAGVNYTFVDTHGVLSSRPRPRHGVYAPVSLPGGLQVFGRDPDSTSQVWERRGGFPGHPLYREFYRDIGYDLDLDYLAPWLPGGKIRVDTGFKYHAITGMGADKEVYRPELARILVKQHAREFLQARCEQTGRLAAYMDRPPLVVAPYDTELFGHWWFEGPWWIREVLEQVEQYPELELITPSQYLSAYPENQPVKMSASSWGEGGYNYVWLNGSNDWIYRHQHRAESALVEMSREYTSPSQLQLRALNQAWRELLLAQSSDWAFIMKQNTTVEYATSRFKQHMENLLALLEQVQDGTLDEGWLDELAKANNIFPWLDYRMLGRGLAGRPDGNRHPLRVLMLSWEFPPRTVGGLARHVHDLSRALAQLGVEVHVLTCPAGRAPTYEQRGKLHIHRVAQQKLTAGDFMTWLGQLNQGMVELAGVLFKKYRFDLVHAHDWLVKDAVGQIVAASGLPLLVTIHATEYGRNNGLHNDVQRYIHQQERELTHMASWLICCSEYMASEVAELFQIERNKIEVIPNGVDVASLQLEERLQKEVERVPGRLVFLGRLVPEKGAQVLIQALATLQVEFPHTHLLVAGRGPYERALQEQAAQAGVAGKVEFVGFVNDLGRNILLASAQVAVFPSLYEPFGIVALEAMAAGVPVVISDTGGLAEIVRHGVDGFKAPPGDARLLARYIGELLSHPGLADEFRAQALKKVKYQYNWQQIALHTCTVYERVLSSRSGTIKAGHA